MPNFIKRFMLVEFETLSVCVMLARSWARGVDFRSRGSRMILLHPLGQPFAATVNPLSVSGWIATVRYLAAAILPQFSSALRHERSPTYASAIRRGRLSLSSHSPSGIFKQEGGSWEAEMSLRTPPPSFPFICESKFTVRIAKIRTVNLLPQIVAGAEGPLYGYPILHSRNSGVVTVKQPHAN